MFSVWKPRRHVTELFEAQRGRCASCGERFPPAGDLSETLNHPSIDHIKARSIGGIDDITNMVLMHVRCNSAKMHREPNGCERIYHDLVLTGLELHPTQRQWQNVPIPNNAMAEALREALTPLANPLPIR